MILARVMGSYKRFMSKTRGLCVFKAQSEQLTVNENILLTQLFFPVNPDLMLLDMTEQCHE